jgi:DNA-binding response OmpR family regulator
MCRLAPRLLIVEPNRSALAVLTKRLGEAGFRVIACDNAGNATAEMMRAPVDLVVAELRMEPVSGIELTRRIRDDTMFSDTPVILITGKSDSAAVDGFGAGADDVVAAVPFRSADRPIARRIAHVRAERNSRRQCDPRCPCHPPIELGETRAALQQSEAEASSNNWSAQRPFRNSRFSAADHRVPAPARLHEARLVAAPVTASTVSAWNGCWPTSWAMPSVGISCPRVECSPCQGCITRWRM